MASVLKRLYAHPDRSALALLLVVAVLLMLPYLVSPGAAMWPRSHLGTDLVTYNWPPFEYIRQSVRAYHEIPLWWGTAMGGIPMIGNPGVRVFYPPLLLLAVLPLPIPLAFALVNTFHFWLAGAGAYGLLRLILKTGRMAALFGGFAMLLTPRLSSNMVGDMGYTAGLCWVPLVILCVRLALDRRSWRWSIAAGAALATLFFLNFVFVLYLAPLFGVYVLYRWAEILAHQDRRQAAARIARSAGILVLMGLVALGLAAFHLLPLLTYLPYQVRDAMTLEDANYLALPLPFLANMVVPSPFKFPEWEAYAGLLPLVLLPLALRHPNRRETRLWLFVLAFAVLFSLGSVTPLYTLMFRFVPGFRLMRVPARMWYFAAIAIVMLASLGVDELVQIRKRSLSRGAWRWLMGSSLTLVVITVLGRFLTRRPDELDWTLGIVAGIGLGAALVSVWRWQQNRLNGPQLAATLIFALVLDLFPLDRAFAMPKSLAEVFDLPEVAASLPRTSEGQVPVRIYSIRHEVGDHRLVANRWQSAEGLNSFQFAPYAAYMRTASGCALEAITAAVPPCAANEISGTAYLEALPNMALLGALNVRYVIAPFDLQGVAQARELTSAGEEHLYENEAVLPRAYAVGRAALVSDDQAWASRLSGADLRQVAFVEAQAADFVPPDNDFFMPAAITTYQPNEIDLTVDLPSAGLLVVADAWVPGWQALVDGQSAPVLRVNQALRGVYLDAGSHQVQMRFVPPAFVAGLTLTLLVGMAAIVVLLRRR